MFPSYHYQSRSDAALEMAQNSDVPTERRGYIELSIYWRRLAMKAAEAEKVL